MYNRYIPRETVYRQIDEHSSPQSSRQIRRETHRPPPPPDRGDSPLDGITGRLGGLLKNIHLDKLDSGDILLALILLFLFLESDDNLELVIALGLTLAFSLFRRDKDEEEDC